MIKQNNIVVKQYVDELRNAHIAFCYFDNKYGVLCDATNENLVHKMYTKLLPQRMYLLVDNVVKLRHYVSEIPEIAYDLWETSENNVLIVFSELQNLSATIQQNSANVALGVLSDGFLQNLLQQCRIPLLFIPFVSETDKEIAEIQHIIPYFNMVFDKNRKLYAGYGIIKLQKDGTFVILRK